MKERENDRDRLREPKLTGRRPLPGENTMRRTIANMEFEQSGLKRGLIVREGLKAYLVGSAEIMNHVSVRCSSCSEDEDFLSSSTIGGLRLRN